MRLGAALAVAALAMACERSSPETQLEGRAPGTQDRGELCADVGFRRACWGTAGEVRLLERTLPNGPQPKGGWRCSGSGNERKCAPRARGPGGFSCDAAHTCTQRRPRYPDDGEWECIDRFGVAICRGGVPPAGIAAGRPDPGWICGSGSSSLWGNRVCVDLSPDMPDDQYEWSCRYEAVGDERRVCVVASEPRMGGTCGAGAICPEGSTCVSGACLPPKPQPSCFADSDCGATQCLFGTCAPGTQ